MKADDNVNVFAIVFAVLAATLLVTDWILAIRQGEKNLDFLFVISGIFIVACAALIVGRRRRDKRRI